MRKSSPSPPTSRAVSSTLELRDLKPLYLVVGDEVYYRDRFRDRLLEHVPADQRGFCVFEEDLAVTPLDEILDLSRNPSLMAPLQLVFTRGLRELFGRGGADSPIKKKHGNFPDNLASYVSASSNQSPPSTVLVLIADHIHIPADRFRISLDDRSRLQRLEETIGPLAETVTCARASLKHAAAVAAELASENGATLGAEEARYLAELLDGNLGLMRNEVAKLALHAAGSPISRTDIDELVEASRQGSAFELALQLARGDRRTSLESFRRLWADEGESSAIPLLVQLSRTFKMAFLLRQANARDRRAVYEVLPDGLRPPGFAAETVLTVSRVMPVTKLHNGIRLFHAADVELRSNPISSQMTIEKMILDLTCTSVSN